MQPRLVDSLVKTASVLKTGVAVADMCIGIIGVVKAASTLASMSVKASTSSYQSALTQATIGIGTKLEAGASAVGYASGRK